MFADADSSNTGHISFDDFASYLSQPVNPKLKSSRQVRRRGRRKHDATFLLVSLAFLMRHKMSCQDRLVSSSRE
eukprot:COSAG06_NODE_16378_length_1004_cov_1.379006_1_plen_74_part_00